MLVDLNHTLFSKTCSRKQHQYHSQRQPRPDSQTRPASNYYEYETVQSVLNSRQIRQTNPQVHSSNQSGSSHNNVYLQHDRQNNNLMMSQSRQQNVRHNGNVNSRQGTPPHRGPFVTQVTIGEHQKNGTKV